MCGKTFFYCFTTSTESIASAKNVERKNCVNTLLAYKDNHWAKSHMISQEDRDSGMFLNEHTQIIEVMCTLLIFMILRTNLMSTIKMIYS